MRSSETFSKVSSNEVVAYTATAGTSAAVGAQINNVRLVSTTACHIAFGRTATTSDPLLPANSPEIFGINPGQTVSAIQSSGSSGGNLHVTQLTK